MRSRFRKAGSFPAFFMICLFITLFGFLFWDSLARASGQPDEPYVDHDWITINHNVSLKKFLLAEKQIGNYIKFHPKNYQAYTLGGRIARKIHRPGDGISILDKGLRQFPGDRTLLRLKAELLMEQGEMIRSRGILDKLAKDPTLSREDRAKIREDRKTLEVLSMSLPPLETFDQNINFQETVPPPLQSPSTYEIENSDYHVHVQNVDIGYSGGSTIGTGITVETPLIKDIVHFQVGTNIYVGSAAGQTSAPEDYFFAGVDGQGPGETDYLLDVGNVFAGNEINAGVYGHFDLPLGRVRIDGQGWYQLPWSGYGQALLNGALQSGGLLNGTLSLFPTLTLSGEYEYTYDTLGGSKTPFGLNHNTMFALDWDFLKKPDLHLIVGYDTQSFTPFIPNATSLVPVLLSSNFGFAGLSTLDQIGRFVVLNGQIGGVVGTFDSPGPLVGLQADGGVSVQAGPHLEFYGNVSYESLAAAYVGAVTTMMFGLNIWL